MPVPQFILDRVKNAKVTGPILADLMIQLAATIEANAFPGGEVTMHYVNESDELRPGDLVPHITVSLEGVPNEPICDRVQGVEATGKESV